MVDNSICQDAFAYTCSLNAECKILLGILRNISVEVLFSL